MKDLSFSFKAAALAFQSEYVLYFLYDCKMFYSLWYQSVFSFVSEIRQQSLLSVTFLRIESNL